MLDIYYTLFDNWDKNKINYAICHGIENLPNGVGRDIDVIVEKRHIQNICEISIDVLNRYGYDVITPPNPWNAKWIFAKKNNHYIELDFIHTINFGPIILVNKPLPTHRIHGIKYDLWAMFIKTLFLAIISGTKNFLWEFEKTDEEYIKNNLKKYYSEKLTEDILYLIKGIKINELEKIKKHIIIETKLYIFKNPITFIKGFFPYIKREILPFYYKVAPVIGIHGIDGVGKSTTINYLSNKMNTAFFTGYKINQWNPKFLPPLHKIFRKKPLIQKKDELIIPRNEPGNLQFIRQLYYAMDFILGRFIIDRVNTSQLKPVIYDRSFLDVWVNPERFGWKITKLTKIFYNIIPKNDLNILLYNNVKDVYKRKPELPMEIIRVHQSKWLELYRKGKIDFTIRVNRSPEVIAAEIKDLILQKFFHLHRKDNYSFEHQLQWVNSFFPTSQKKSNILLLALLFPDGRGFLFENKNLKQLNGRLSIYLTHSRKARSIQRLIGLLGKVGIASKLMKKMEIDVETFNRFLRFVKSQLGIDSEITYSISLGAPGPRRKLVFCITDLQDNILAYVKLANNNQAKIGIKTETKTLKFLKNQLKEPIEIPRILYDGEWEDFYCSILTPIHQQYRPNAVFILSDEQLVNMATYLSKINFEWLFLKDSIFFQQLSDAVVAIETPYLKHLCEDALELVLRLANDKPIPFHFAHGDLTPWNMVIRQEKIGLFDFEYALMSAPAGYDTIHYLLRKISLIYGKSPIKIYNQLQYKSGWYKVVDQYFLELIENPSEREYIISVIFLMYIIHSITIYDKENNPFSFNIKLYSYLLNLIFMFFTINGDSFSN